jgi:uncharacterized membrane protein YozB (DUF420 family)
MRTSYSPPRSLPDAILQWCIWVLLSTFALVLPLGIAYLARMDFFSILLPLVAGIAVGSAQWLFLRSLQRAHHWVIAAAIGYPFLGLGFLVDALVYGLGMLGKSGIFGGTSSNSDLATWYVLSSLVLAISSIPLGLFQLAILRGWFSRPAAWIPATCTAWFLASLILLSADLTKPTTAATVVVFAATIPPALTGVALFFLNPKEALDPAGA